MTTEQLTQGVKISGKLTDKKNSLEKWEKGTRLTSSQLQYMYGSETNQWNTENILISAEEFEMIRALRVVKLRKEIAELEGQLEAL